MQRGDCVTPGAICCSMYEVHFAVKNLEGNELAFAFFFLTSYS